MLLHEKANQAEQLLKETGLDCWLTFVRETETHPDPGLDLVLGCKLTWFSALLFGREWIRSWRERQFSREVERHSGLPDRLRGGSPEEFREALGRLRRIRDPYVAEALLDKAAEGAPPEVRKLLTQACDDLGITHRYVDDLRNAASWERRALAAERLGRIGSAEALGPSIPASGPATSCLTRRCV